MATTEGLTEASHNAAVEAAVDLIREKHPSLDLRVGTAIRALVIEPGATLSDAQRDTVDRLRTAMSLKLMAEAGSVPRDDADAVLSNFGISLGGGSYASGFVRVNLIGQTQVTLRSGVVFRTESGVEFITTDTVTASTDPVDGEAEIVSSEDGKYYFTAPVTAKEEGVSGNIVRGTSLSCSVLVTNYYSAEAFSDFTGGEDGETVASAVARIPSALAYRGMTNSLSTRAQFASRMVDASLLRAVSCVGYRNRAQLRDRHNPFGIALGGRVDVYARLFDAPGVVSFIADGVKDDTPVSEGECLYRIPIPSYPGFYGVKCVGPADQPDRQGSLPYRLVRGTVSGATSCHDFKVTDTDNCETAWSSYQDGYVLATVSADSFPESLKFKVDLFWTDGITELQTIADADEVRNVAADYVVRSPAICLVSMSTHVRLKKGVLASPEDLQTAVATYVNGRSFVSRLTRSELANVLIQNGVESVDMSDSGMYLGGRICGADGEWYYLEGDSLDVTDVGTDRAMIVPSTVVFAAEPGAIQISISS